MESGFRFLYFNCKVLFLIGVTTSAHGFFDKTNQFFSTTVLENHYNIVVDMAGVATELSRIADNVAKYSGIDRTLTDEKANAWKIKYGEAELENIAGIKLDSGYLRKFIQDYSVAEVQMIIEDRFLAHKINQVLMANLINALKGLDSLDKTVDDLKNTSNELMNSEFNLPLLFELIEVYRKQPTIHPLTVANYLMRSSSNAYIPRNTLVKKGLTEEQNKNLIYLLAYSYKIAQKEGKGINFEGITYDNVNSLDYAILEIGRHYHNVVSIFFQNKKKKWEQMENLKGLCNEFLELEKMANRYKDKYNEDMDFNYRREHEELLLALNLFKKGISEMNIDTINKGLDLSIRTKNFNFNNYGIKPSIFAHLRSTLNPTDIMTQQCNFILEIQNM